MTSTSAVAADGTAQERDRIAPAEEWVRYLDRLEAAARAMDDQLLADAAPDVAPLGAIVPPDGPLPARLADRRTLLLALLQDVTARAETRRDAIAAELASTTRKRRPGVAADAPSTLGGALDVVG